MNGDTTGTAGLEPADPSGADDHPERPRRRTQLELLTAAKEALQYSNKQEAQEALQYIDEAIGQESATG